MGIGSCNEVAGFPGLRKPAASRRRVATPKMALNHAITTRPSSRILPLVRFGRCLGPSHPVQDAAGSAPVSFLLVMRPVVDFSPTDPSEANLGSRKSVRGRPVNCRILTAWSLLVCCGEIFNPAMVGGRGPERKRARRAGLAKAVGGVRRGEPRDMMRESPLATSVRNEGCSQIREWLDSGEPGNPTVEGQDKRNERDRIRTTRARLDCIQ